MDLHEDILKVIQAVDIVFWPVAMDFKYKDVEAMADGSIAVSFINGAIRTSEQEEIAKLLRKKSGLVIAFGACSYMGGIPGLANFWDKTSIFDEAYKDSISVAKQQNVFPQEKTSVAEGELELPSFYDTVKTLHQVIDVDYYLPGCPPTPELISAAVTAILENKLPAKGAVIGPAKSLCYDCPRKGSDPKKISIKELKRPHEVLADPNVCFLEQGIICMGPSTRSCESARCIKANMPCTGCFGPTDNVVDQGGKFVSALASIIDIDNEEDFKKVAETIVDMNGKFYRYGLPASLLQRKKI